MLPRYAAALLGFLVTSATLGAVGFAGLKGIEYLFPEKPTITDSGAAEEKTAVREEVKDGKSGRHLASIPQSAGEQNIGEQSSPRQQEEPSSSSSPVVGAVLEETTTGPSGGWTSSPRTPASAPAAKERTAESKSDKAAPAATPFSYSGGPAESLGGSVGGASSVGSGTSGSNGDTSPSGEPSLKPVEALNAVSGGRSNVTSPDGHKLSISFGAPLNVVNAITTDGHQVKLNAQGTGF